MRRLMHLALPLSLVGVWQICAQKGLVLTPPKAVVDAFLNDLMSGRLLLDTGFTLARLLLGTLIGAILGVAMGYALAFNRAFRDIVGPTLSIISQFPPIVWTPFVIATAGIGDAAKIVLVSISAFLIWCPAQLKAIEDIDPRLTEVLLAYDVDRNTALRYFYFPATLPALGQALHNSVVFGWIILIAAELIGSSNGLGWYVWDARNFGRTPQFLAGLLVTGIIGAMLSFAAQRTIRTWTAWLPNRNFG